MKLLSDHVYDDLYMFKFDPLKISKDFEDFFPQDNTNSSQQSALLHWDDMYFDENKKALVIRNESLSFGGINQMVVCEVLVNGKLGQKFTTRELEDSIDASSDRTSQSSRRIYDTARAVNKAVDKKFGIKRFIVSGTERYWIREELFKG